MKVYRGKKFEIVDKEYRKFPNKDIKLPERKTKESAGYDFYSNQTVNIPPGQSYIFWTDVKVLVESNQFLMVVPRSSTAFNKSIMLMNTIGVVDADYYNNEDNDGNIAICLFNFGDSTISIKEGERFAQGIIAFYDNEPGEHVEETRKGGLGSTEVDADGGSFSATVILSDSPETSQI